MTSDSDLKMAEILASRLCHDIAGPLAAVSNGVELLSDPEFGGDAEAVGLLNDSISQAAASLRFLRSAFGTAGEAEGRPEHLQRLAEAWTERRRIRLEWGLKADTLEPTEGKLLLNLIGVAGDGLPRGGVVTAWEEGGSVGRRLTVSAEGVQAHLRPEVAEALEAETPAALNARGAQAYLLRRLAESLNGSLKVEVQGEERLDLKAVLPG